LIRTEPHQTSNSSNKTIDKCIDAGQGDQIWRIFAYLAIVFFGQFLEKYCSGRYFLLLFSQKKSGWATLRAIFPPTHLVTLTLK
jgi:hypothetical protein